MSLRGKRSLRRRRFEEDFDPMSSMGNMADCMLVLACGLLLALMIHWNVDVEQAAQQMPDTKYEVLELHEDGTTNFNNIIWKDKYLIITENKITYYSYLHKPKKKYFKTYMNVLINQKESNSRPYEYYYKKIN